MEIGITGGEEDGVNNEDVDNNSLYTQPEDIYDIYKALSFVSPYFSKPGMNPTILIPAY
jgi:fructose-bisphosphate aldolase class II